MDLKKFFYKKDVGWSVSEFPKWDSPQTLIFIFGASSYLQDSEKIKEITDAYPQSHVVGCSSAGEIFDLKVIDDSLAVAIIRFSGTRVQVFSEPIQLATDSGRVGQTLAEKLVGPDLVGAMVFSDGLKVNGTQFVQGINSKLPKTTILTGGLAGDGPHFKQTWVIKDKIPQSGFVTAVGLYGKKVRIGHGSKGGWDIFGPERKVTRSENNVLYELDGKPALSLYKEYLGDKASELPASGLLFPLQIRSSRTDEKKIVRTILAVDEDKQSVIFAGDVPEGSFGQFMRANFDRLIEGACEAATGIDKVSAPTLVIAISCVGRRLVLGERTEEEIEAVLEKLSPGLDQIGFYSYGEISPYVKGSACELHNQTMTITTISED